jgi:Runt domain
VTTYTKAIKVTVDGPREPRSKTRKCRSFGIVWPTQMLLLSTETLKFQQHLPDFFPSIFPIVCYRKSHRRDLR